MREKEWCKKPGLWAHAQHTGPLDENLCTRYPAVLLFCSLPKGGYSSSLRSYALLTHILICIAFLFIQHAYMLVSMSLPYFYLCVSQDGLLELPSVGKQAVSTRRTQPAFSVCIGYVLLGSCCVVMVS
jgi:hypothetical protein